jgi:hypothetical protein
MANDKVTATPKGQLDYSWLTTQDAEGKVVPCTFDNIGVFATGFTVAVTHPAGIWGFRDFFKENHLLTPGFAYNVGNSNNVAQFSAPIFYMTLDEKLLLQTNTSLLDNVTTAQTGNNLTNFAIAVSAPIALTRCSDFAVVINPGLSVVFTFQAYLKQKTR